jgi:hypothetical protein
MPQHRWQAIAICMEVVTHGCSATGPPGFDPIIGTEPRQFSLAEEPEIRHHPNPDSLVVILSLTVEDSTPHAQWMGTRVRIQSDAGFDTLLTAVPFACLQPEDGGLRRGLATYYDASGAPLATLGHTPARTPAILDVRGMKQEIIDGRVPAFFRNLVYPVFAPDGDMWLILTGEARVQRYDATGNTRFSVSLAAPELERIWQAVVARAEETLDDPRRIDGPVYVLDAAVVGQELWMLLNMPAPEPAVILALTTDGRFEQTVVFSEVRDALSFAVDRARGRVYFTIPTSASVVATPLPAGWH